MIGEYFLPTNNTLRVFSKNHGKKHLSGPKQEGNFTHWIIDNGFEIFILQVWTKNRRRTSERVNILGILLKLTHRGWLLREERSKRLWECFQIFPSIWRSTFFRASSFWTELWPTRNVSWSYSLPESLFWFIISIKKIINIS